MAFSLFESLAINIQNQKRLLAQFYNWLLIRTSVVRTAEVKWGRELSANFTASQWERLNMFNQTFSENVNIRESRYKMLYKWYLTPI